MNPTRRQLIKTLAGITIGANGASQTVAASPFDRINRYPNEMESYLSHMKRKAYVAIPSFSFTYLYMNMHNIMGKRPHPVIIMDSHDYERLWAWVSERQSRSRQMLGMITDSLRRRGLIRTIDYRTFYSAPQQEKQINALNDALDRLPGHKQQQVAEELAEGYLNHYSRPDYQESFRKALGSWDGFRGRQQKIERHQRKIGRGGGIPVHWDKRSISQYITALEVRRVADNYLPYDVVGIIAQGEYEGVATMLRDSTYDGGEIASLGPDGKTVKEIRQLPPDKTAFERSVLDTISQVAKEATGVQNNDWYLVGSHLAVPHFPKLFVESWSQPEVRHKSTKKLARETKDVLDELETRAADNRPSHIQDDGAAIAEEHGTSSESRQKEITEQLGRATDLANFTPVLRDIAENEDYSEGSIIAAASAMMDPNRRITEDEVFRQAWEIKQRHKRVNIPDHVIDRYGNRGGFRRGKEKEEQRGDWYQVEQRKMV